MKGHFLISRKERDCKKVLERVKRKQTSLKEASVVLHMSYRQCQRIYKRYVDEENSGLIHRLVGKPSNRAIEPEVKKAILERYQQRYCDFGPTLASEEKLGLDGYKVDHETLRQWLIKESLWYKPQRDLGTGHGERGKHILES